MLSSTHYYRLAGHLLGELQLSGSSSTTTFFLTDGLGSVLGVFSDTASTASLLSTQLFTPYGTQLVANGNSIGQYTAKGFTGQYADSVSGLDYYVSRYYDPVAGVFLSADKATGNAQGMNPYGYVGNNPETANDPTGQIIWCGVNCGGGSGSGGSGNSGSSGSSGGDGSGTSGSHCGCKADIAHFESGAAAGGADDATASEAAIDTELTDLELTQLEDEGLTPAEAEAELLGEPDPCRPSKLSKAMWRA